VRLPAAHARRKRWPGSLVKPAVLLAVARAPVQVLPVAHV